MKTSHRAIGVFDSGFGGLTILRGIVDALPMYDYVYLGDTARAPYGPQSSEVVYQYTVQALEELFAQGCEIVILACNTASSDALRRVQQEYLPMHRPDKKVLGVLVPAAESAVVATRNQKVGVVATEGTVRSGAFVREIQTASPACEVYQQACPLLVPIIENGDIDDSVIHPLLVEYLELLLDKEIDTLILGCTHYNILRTQITEIVGKDMIIIDESECVPEKLLEYLSRHPMLESLLTRGATRTFLTTDTTKSFEILGSEFYGESIVPENISL